MRKQILLLSLAFFILMSGASATAAQTGRKSVSAAEVNGTYKLNFRGKFRSMANEVKVLALGGGKIRFALDLIFPYTMRNGETMVNMGGLDGEAVIDGDTAVYESEEFGACKITIKFVRPGTVRVTQDGTDAACGFGHNVSSQGTYRKVSARKPKFED